MMKFILIKTVSTLIVCFLFFLTNAQNSRKELGYSENVKSVKYIEKDAIAAKMQNLSHLINIKNYDTVPITTLIYYDFSEDGKILRKDSEIYYHSQYLVNRKGFEKYGYDDKNRIVETYCYNENSILDVNQSKYSIYDNSINASRKLNFADYSKQFGQILHYDFYGNLLDWYKGEELEESYKYKYKGNNIIKKTQIVYDSRFCSEGHFWYIEKLEYNNRNILTTKYFYPDYINPPKFIVKTIYKYNNNDVLIEEIKILNKKDTTRTKHIKFDDISAKDTMLLKDDNVEKVYIYDKNNHITYLSFYESYLDSKSLIEVKYTYDIYGNCLDIETFENRCSYKLENFTYEYFKN